MRSSDLIKRIISFGHNVGLHFDEVRYCNLSKNPEMIKTQIIEEADLLSKAVGTKVMTVSMHRPSKIMLEGDLKIPGMVSSYSRFFFKEFKYLSDSRRRWREPVEDIISSNEYSKLHILTHPFWYFSEERDINETVKSFINRASHERYRTMHENITDLEEIMSIGEII